jgi:hypothetical protein
VLFEEQRYASARSMALAMISGVNPARVMMSFGLAPAASRMRRLGVAVLGGEYQGREAVLERSCTLAPRRTSSSVIAEWCCDIAVSTRHPNTERP